MLWCSSGGVAAGSGPTGGALFKQENARPCNPSPPSHVPVEPGYQRDHLVERTDHVPWRHGPARRSVPAAAVEPDARDPHALRAADVPFQVVTDHDGVAGGDAELVERTVEDGRLGLAAADLTLDRDGIEVVGEPVARQLAAPHAMVAVGREAQHVAAGAERIQARSRVGEEAVGSTAAGVELRRDPRGELLIRAADPGEGAAGDLAPRGEHLDALRAMPDRIAPEPRPRLLDGDGQRLAVEAGRTGGVTARGHPQLGDAAAVVEQRVVEIEDHRPHGGTAHMWAMIA